jgi:hypothetical protein
VLEWLEVLFAVVEVERLEVVERAELMVLEVVELVNIPLELLLEVIDSDVPEEVEEVSAVD